MEEVLERFHKTYSYLEDFTPMLKRFDRYGGILSRFEDYVTKYHSWQIGEKWNDKQVISINIENLLGQALIDNNSITAIRMEPRVYNFMKNSKKAVKKILQTYASNKNLAISYGPSNPHLNENVHRNCLETTGEFKHYQYDNIFFRMDQSTLFLPKENSIAYYTHVRTIDPIQLENFVKEPANEIMLAQARKLLNHEEQEKSITDIPLIAYIR